MKKDSGFTLVELAIVLMIIGLLIGGVLRGQELMTNARVAATAKQVTSYVAAMTSFQDSYSALPGDMPQATNRVSGCSAANTCQNGDGNGMVGERDNVWNLGNQDIDSENTQFWKHLALAHLISGINPSAGTIDWGQSHPEAEFPGGYTILQTLNVGSTAGGNFSGLALRLQSGPRNSPEHRPPISPRIAAMIDRKMDDGVPSTGDVQASASGNGGLADGCEIAYDETRDDNFCAMSFMLKR